MLRAVSVITLAIFLGVISLTNTFADEPLGVKEFKNLYDSLLAGKTLVNETQSDGMVIKKERLYGKSVDTGDGDFDIPVYQLMSFTKDGKSEMKVKVNILDRVNDLGGNAIIQEELYGISVIEEGDKVAEDDFGVDFGGIFRVGKNAQGGFDVHNFSMRPSVLIDGDNLSLTGSMITYSCSAQDGKTVCNYTVRDFELGEYVPYVGYKIGKPIGDDYTETYVSIQPPGKTKSAESPDKTKEAE
jgi:hypothetical protein